MTDKIIPIRDIPKGRKNGIVQMRDGKPVTTSLIVAEKFGKLHKNVIRDIENLECPEEFSGLNFEPGSYTDAQNQERPMYLITRDGFTLLAMGFTGKEAMAWKLKYIHAFNEMEKMIQGRHYTQLSKDDSDGISFIMSAVDDIKRQMDRLTEFRKYSDNPVAPFCDDSCSIKTGGLILKDEIYDRYLFYCEHRDEYALTKPVFFRKLYQYASFIKSVRRMIRGKAAYGITGLSLKEVAL